ncbi:hypothetical protein BS50DRAFT_361114 [Corynespora cassiicola Philippines]|uniref:Uncharacterized protein n=1 Tax=Corynespora cassiicola Philippines TaxID=1448308 RepID=A0A2T2NSS8_CORCC|nr:hypothetical protein BS50DRAFT_361114 [Corynespora cassiicola Philippines]
MFASPLALPVPSIIIFPSFFSPARRASTNMETLRTLLAGQPLFGLSAHPGSTFLSSATAAANLQSCLLSGSFF